MATKQAEYQKQYRENLKNEQDKQWRVAESQSAMAVDYLAAHLPDMPVERAPAPTDDTRLMLWKRLLTGPYRTEFARLHALAYLRYRTRDVQEREDRKRADRGDELRSQIRNLLGSLKDPSDLLSRWRLMVDALVRVTLAWESPEFDMEHIRAVTRTPRGD